jgi:hypothetical protein
MYYRSSKKSAGQGKEGNKMEESLQRMVPPGILDAEYRQATLPEHAGNPLIEALPPFKPASELIDHFGVFPVISADERRLPDAERMLAVSRLNAYLEPLPSHYDIIEKIGLIVRSGYTHRNPLNETYRKSLIKFYHEAMDGKVRPIGASSPSTAPSFALFGVSGVGKTTVIDRSFSFLPQVLNHKKHQFLQVVWLKLDCPMDGSLKQLLGSLLTKIDNLLGTSYMRSVGTRTVIDELILSAAKIAARHHLGVLVIDEIQNLLDASGVGQAKMLNFFVTFANEVKIPVVTVGTPRALSLLEGTFREARRVGDHGTSIWDAHSYGEEWKFFLKGLWKYQWTTSPVKLNDQLSALFYKRTQGIPALVVRLFQLSQLQAIRDGSESLTEDLIAEVAEEKFKLVAPMLEALRTHDKKAIMKYEDLLDRGIREINTDVDREAKLALLKEQAQKRNQESAERTRTISALIAMGFEQETVQDIVTQFFETNPKCTSAKAVRAILGALEEHKGNGGTAQNESLKDIVGAAKKSGGSPIKALSSAGLVGGA